MSAAVTYQGIELLLRHPEYVDKASVREAMTLATARFVGAQGASVMGTQAATAKDERTLTWLTHDRADYVEVMDFLRRRRGRFKAFWCPSYRQDMTLLAHTGGHFDITRAGYADAFSALIAPYGTAVDHLIGFNAQMQYAIARISAAAAFDATTERLTVSGVTAGTMSGAPFPVATAGGMLARLQLCRLADDDVTVRHITATTCLIEVPVVTTLHDTP